MNHFTLFAHGDEFDVDSALKNSSLTVSRIWRRGDQRGCGIVDSQYPTSGIEIELGNGLVLSVDEQEEIALKFVVEYRDELKKLADNSEVETFKLGLQYHLNDPNVSGLCMSLSPQLMELALEVGFSPTFYVTVDYWG